MKKFIIALMAVSVVGTACKKDDDDDGNGNGGCSFPTHCISAEDKQREMLIYFDELPGPTISQGYMVRETALIHDDRNELCSFTVPEPGGPLWDTSMIFFWEYAEFPSPPVYRFENITADFTGLIEAVETYNTSIPYLGVTHATGQNDTAYVVHPRVEFYEDTTGLFFVQSYLLATYEGREYNPDLDLRVPEINNILEENIDAEMIWQEDIPAMDTSLEGHIIFKEGEVFRHKDVMMGMGKTDSLHGRGIAEVNPFGPEFLQGDVMGGANSQLSIYIPKKEIHAKARSRSFLTVVWKFDPMTEEYKYVNAYKGK